MGGEGAMEREMKERPPSLQAAVAYYTPSGTVEDCGINGGHRFYYIHLESRRVCILY